MTLSSEYQYIGRTSGVGCDAGWTYYVLLYAKTSGSVATGKHTVSVKLRLACTHDSTFFGYRTDGSLTIGGVSAISWTNAQVPNTTWSSESLTVGGVAYSRWVDLKEGSAVIDTAFGKKDITIAAAWSRRSIDEDRPGWLPYTTQITASITATLPKIAGASAPTLSASTVTMGSDLTVYTNREHSSFTHALSYTFAGKTVDITAAAGASYVWSVPDLAGDIKGSLSGKCSITCVTKSGDLTVGTKTVELTLNVPAASTVTAPASAQMLGTAALTIHAGSDAFTHVLTYSVAGVTGEIYSGSERSCDWSIPDMVGKLSGGSGVCTVTCKTYNGTALVGSNSTTVMILAPDTAVPTLSAVAVKMGEAVTIFTNRQSAAYTHIVTYQIGTHTGEIARNVGDACNWDVPTALAAYTGGKTEADCVITCKIFNGATQLGVEAVTVKLLVPDATVPGVSAGSVNLGESITITLPRETEAYAHLLTYTLVEGESVVASGEIGTVDGNSYTWLVPTELAQKISGTEGQIEITCQTVFKDTETAVGSHTAAFAVTVPDTEGFLPVIGDIVVRPVNSFLRIDDQTVFLEGKSKAKITVTATSPIGAQIVSYVTQIDGQVLEGSSVTTPNVLSTAGDAIAVKCTVTDDKGRSASKTTSICVHPYRKPRAIPPEGYDKIQCYRCDENGVKKKNGTSLYVHVERSYHAAPGGLKNTCTLAISMKGLSKNLLESYDEGNVYKNWFVEQVPDVTKAYRVKFAVLDDVGGQSVVTVIVPSAFVTWHTPIGGHGFTLGGYHDPDKVDVFDCLFDAEFEGDVYGRVVGLGALPAVTTGNSKEPGVYAVAAAQTGSILGLPENPGVLQVWNADGLDDENTLCRMQKFIRADNAGDYRRSLSRETVDDAWSEGAWKVKTWDAV